MSDSDTCGWPTAEGSGCKHPPTEDNGRCWLHADDDRDLGRPTKFNDKRARTIINAASEPVSDAGCARAAGITGQTLANWLNKDLTYENEAGEEVDFFEAFTRARYQVEKLLTKGPLIRRNDVDNPRDDVDGQQARFLLSTTLGYVKVEGREISGPGGAPIRTEEVSEEEMSVLLEAFDEEPET